MLNIRGMPFNIHPTAPPLASWLPHAPAPLLQQPPPPVEMLGIDHQQNHKMGALYIRRPQQWAGRARQKKSVVPALSLWRWHLAAPWNFAVARETFRHWPAAASSFGLGGIEPLWCVGATSVALLQVGRACWAWNFRFSRVQKVTLETAVCGLLGPMKPSAGCCFPISDRCQRSTTRLPKTFTGLLVPVPLVKVTLNLFGVLVPLPLPF